MAANKTQPTESSVKAFLDEIEDENRRRDSKAVLALMKRVTNARPKLWGTSIIGFGTYRYKYASGREGSAPVAGFAPRKNDVTVYIMPGFARHDALRAKLGKHTAGKSCLHIKRLSDVDLEVLEELVAESVEHMKAAYPTDMA